MAEISTDYSVLEGDRIIWADNGELRLGVNIGLGGAVTWLSEPGRPNLINSYDWGRQIQMSFYSGPIPFEPEGKKPRPSWAGLGWNPIQSGDCYGHRSKVLDYSVSPDGIYVKCIPMHWPLDDYPGECVFEVWYELSGRSVRVKSRITNDRPDKTQYHGRGQEQPAVYTNGPWYKLVSYTGAEPFTGGNPEVVVDLDDGKGWPWESYTATENWAALLDKEDYGLGVYNGGTSRFIGGFAGKKGAGGPKDAPTGYISPVAREILDYNAVSEYEYTLVVGDLGFIRESVYSFARRPGPRVYDFASGRQGWIYIDAVDSGLPINGGLSFPFTEKTQLVSPQAFFLTTEISSIAIEGRFEFSNGQAGALDIALTTYDGSAPGSIRASLPVENGFDGRLVFTLAEVAGYKDAPAFTELAFAFSGPGSALIRFVSVG